MSEEDGQLPLANLDDHILEQTIDYLGLDSRVCLRKCCKKLRRLTDRRRIHHYQIRMELRPEQIKLGVEVRENEFIEVDYCNHPEGCLVKKSGKEKFLKDQDFVDIALIDLKVYTSRPRVTIEQLHITREGELATGEDRFFAKLKNFLESLNHQLSVEKFWIDGGCRTEDVMCVLPYLTPGTLTTVHFSHQWNENWRPIVETEQWKRAQHVETCHTEMPIENYFRFRDVTFCPDRFSLEELKKFIEVACQPPYDVQYKFFINVLEQDQEIFDYLDELPNLSRNPAMCELDFQHIRIPNSYNYVRLAVNEEEIDMRTVREPTLFSEDSNRYSF